MLSKPYAFSDVISFTLLRLCKDILLIGPKFTGKNLSIVKFSNLANSKNFIGSLGLHQDVVLQSHSMIYLVLVGKLHKFSSQSDDDDDVDHEILR